MKSAVILLVVFTAQAFAGPQLGTVKCTYGPSYWCASLDNAKECAATQHCIKNTWSKEVKSEGLGDDSTCTFCKDIVSDLHEYIANNETRAEILQYLEKACSFMPDDFSKSECNKIATHYLDQVLAMIEAEIDPETICTLIHMCGNGQHKDLPVQQSPNKFRTSVSSHTPEGSSLCDMCTQAETYLRTQVDDKKNQDAVKKMLQTACEKLGGDLAAECEQEVGILLPKLVSFVDENLNSQLCVMLHMCESEVDVLSAAKASLVAHIQESSMARHIVGVASRVGADECTMCEEVFNFIHIFLMNNATEQQAQSMVENELCPQLGALSSECKELVEQYFPAIWSELLSLLDPKSICTDLHLCTSAPAVVAAQQPVGVSVECVICEFVMEKLEDLLSKNSTEADIVAALEEVCGLLPSSVADECDQFVEKYTAQIINLLTNGVSPKMICSTLTLCSAPKLEVTGENCIMCEMALAYVKSDLAKNATQQQVMQALDKLCSKLSQDLSQQCAKIVTQFGPNIMKILSSDMNAAQLCADLGLCSSKVNNSQPDGLVHLYNRQSNV